MKALDGPAKGVRLSLRTCPTYLRLVQDQITCEWDALDQPGDRARPSEVVYAYKMKEKTWSQVFVCRPSDGSPGGRFEYGEYCWLGVVAPNILRNRPRWVAWCKRRIAKVD